MAENSAPHALVIAADAEERWELGRVLRECGYQVKSADSMRHVDSEADGTTSLFVIDGQQLGTPCDVALKKLLAKRSAAALVLVYPVDHHSQLEVLRCEMAEPLLKPFCPEELRLRLSRLGRRQHLQRDVDNSQKFLKQVTEATPELLYLFDLEAGENVYVNRRLCAALGCRPHEIHAEACFFFASVAHPDETASLVESHNRWFSRAKDDEVIESEFRVRNSRGDWRWLHCREVVFERTPTGAVKQILGTAQDVTDRKELEQTQALLSAIVTSSEDAIIGKTLDGEILSWNEAAHHMYGYTEAEAVGQNISLLVPADRVNEVPDLLERIGRGQRVDRYETSRHCKDGTVIQVLLTVSPIRNRAGQVTGASTIARRL